MRKLICVALAGAFLLGPLGPPAAAGGKKKVHDVITATLAPFPKLAAWGDPIGLTKPGCSSGQENLHWVGKQFKSPGVGTLRFYMEGFTGDHDIYIFAADGELPLARGEQAQVPDGAPPEEEIRLPLKKGQKVILVACNWLGEPSVEAHYEGTFKV
jgi:hypothetical protein